MRCPGAIDLESPGELYFIAEEHCYRMIEGEADKLRKMLGSKD